MTGMTQLVPLAGRWSTAITMIHPPEAKGDVHHAVDTYRWLSGGEVLVHEVQARMGGDCIESIEIYTEDGGRIVSTSFDGSGRVADYRAELADGVFRIEGETERFASRPISGSVIEGSWQLKVDGQWLDWMNVRLERVA